MAYTWAGPGSKNEQFKTGLDMKRAGFGAGLVFSKKRLGGSTGRGPGPNICAGPRVSGLQNRARSVTTTNGLHFLKNIYGI